MAVLTYLLDPEDEGLLFPSVLENSLEVAIE